MFVSYAEYNATDFCAVQGIAVSIEMLRDWKTDRFFSMLYRCSPKRGPNVWPVSPVESRTTMTADAIHQVRCLAGERFLDDNGAFRTLQGGVSRNLTTSVTASAYTQRSTHARTRLALITAVY